MTEPTFELRISRAGDAVIVELFGEIDMATAGEFSSAIDRLGAPPLVVVDLAEVAFLDSTALNALVRAQRDLAERGCGFCVVSPSAQSVRRIFELTRLAEPLNMVATRADALA